MIEGCPPFFAKQELEVTKLYAEKERLPFRAPAKHYGHGLKELIQECWHENLAKRPTFRQIIRRLESIHNCISHKNRWKGRKRSRQGKPSAGKDAKTEMVIFVATRDTSLSFDKVSGAAIACSGASGKGNVGSPGTSTTLELRNPPAIAAKTSGASTAQSCQVLPPETWLRNEREMKRERRKQSNRDSTRRSRL